MTTETKTEIEIDVNNQRRFYAACAVLQGIWADPNTVGDLKKLADIAVTQADVLLERLDK
jgi:hypothetical protein